MSEEAIAKLDDAIERARDIKGRLDDMEDALIVLGMYEYPVQDNFTSAGALTAKEFHGVRFAVEDLIKELEP